MTIPRPLLALLALGLLARPLGAADPAMAATVEKITAAAGGESRLLTLFRLRERLNVSADASKPGRARISIVEPPGHWWLGKRERVRDEQEPAIFLVWAWTLGALREPRSQLAPLPDIAESGGPALGIRISGTITPAMDLYFDRATHRLVRIDWRGDTHRFSDWREFDGLHYPARAIGYKKTGQPWYFNEILALERLSALPPEYARRAD